MIGLPLRDRVLVEDDDFGVVAVVAVVVEAVAYYELVGDLETCVVDFDIDGACRLFIQHDSESE